MRTNESPSCAAIVSADDVDADALVAEFARSLIDRGWRVRGLLQSIPDRGDQCNRNIVLVDVSSGERYGISQDLGPGSDSCCIDAGGVAAAGVVLRRALAERVDLAVANRFGKLEAEGGGLAGELLALMAEGVPLLTIVAAKHLERWRHFTGDASALLAPRRDALEAWFSGLRRPVKP